MTEHAHCNHCRRRSIVVDSKTGWLMPHFRRSGRKGGYCPGSNRHRDSQPQAAA